MPASKSLNVFFSVDKNYIVHFTVTVTSLLENNKNLTIKIFIVHDLEYIDVLTNICDTITRKYNAKIFLKELENTIFNNFHISSYISKATYFRLLFAEIIPDDVLYGLSLDCDTIVTGSLRELTELDFSSALPNEEYSIMAVSDKNEEREMKRLAKMGFNTTMYFNAGVMMINLQKWRVDRVSSSLVKIAKDFRNDLVWHDQDVLNIYFRDNCGKLKSTYNKFIDKKLPKLPLIIHFSGSSKPWHYLNEHPYKYEYWKYLQLTDYKNQKFERITPKKVLKKFWRRLKK